MPKIRKVQRHRQQKPRRFVYNIQLRHTDTDHCHYTAANLPEFGDIVKLWGLKFTVLDCVNRLVTIRELNDNNTTFIGVPMEKLRLF